MRTSIRNRLTALILAVCVSIIAIIWLTTTVFFKPMYHAASQAELSGVLNKTTSTLSKYDGILTQEVIDEISGFINYGVCIEISDEFGAGLVLMEGIGDACQLHGGKDHSDNSNIYMDQRRLNTPRAQELRRLVRSSENYTASLTDDYDNQQVLKGRFWNGKYTIIVSTNLARTDAVVRIVSSQLRTVTFIAIVMALIEVCKIIFEIITVK